MIALLMLVFLDDAEIEYLCISTILYQRPKSLPNQAMSTNMIAAPRGRVKSDVVN